MYTNQNYKEILAYIKLLDLGYVYQSGTWVTICESMSKYEPEDLLPTTSIGVEPVSEDIPEWMEGFEDLVFVQPNVLGASVPLKNLTQAQLNFICGYFNISSPLNGKTHFSCLSTGPRYFSAPNEPWKTNYNLSFNDLFIPKS